MSVFEADKVCKSACQQNSPHLTVLLLSATLTISSPWEVLENPKCGSEVSDLLPAVFVLKLLWMTSCPLFPAVRVLPCVAPTPLVLLLEVSDISVLDEIISEIQRTSVFAAVSSLSIIFFIADLLLLSISTSYLKTKRKMHILGIVSLEFHCKKNN